MIALRTSCRDKVRPDEHVKEVFKRSCGKEVGVNKVTGGEVSLFIFQEI